LAWYSELNFAQTILAGNEASDVANFSPARVASAITVGASTIADAVLSTSNYGTLLDIYAVRAFFRLKPSAALMACFL